jgi:two-component system cell cycle response regulator DivK
MAQETILIVDDNPLNMKLVNVLLAGEGYSVRTAGDAKEALAVLHECHPQMILMDIQLPGIDGLELTRRLKADPSTRDITILGLTAYAMKGDEERIRSAGCDGYVPKPIDTRALPGLIKSFLNRETITTVSN